jgi:hypothetical protein
MLIPEEFKYFAQWFYQGSADEFATQQDWVSSAVRRLDAPKRVVLKQFLDELLNGNHDENELELVWASTSADYYVHDMRGFLSMIRDAVGST